MYENPALSCDTHSLFSMNPQSLNVDVTDSQDELKDKTQFVIVMRSDASSEACLCRDTGLCIVVICVLTLFTTVLQP